VDATSTVRLIEEGERRDAVRVIGHGFLAPIDDDITEFWAGFTDPDRTHGAFDPDERLAGIARWFPTDLSTPGGSLAAGAVTAVAVLPTHRRQGHLSRLMEAQLGHIAESGAPVAILVAAEWPIYGRYGYGAATEACAWELDARVPLAHEPVGQIDFAGPEEVRSHIQRVHDAMAAHRPGVLTRDERMWDLIAGVEQRPGGHGNPALQRAALWRDGSEVRGVVRYQVEERWTRNRPDGRATITELFAADPLATRELYRHVLTLDWVRTVRSNHRPVDDPVPLWLVDGRAAVQRDRFDHAWVRVLDVPAALGARQAGAAGDVVVEVIDERGPAGGRWRVHGAAGEPIEVAATSEPVAVRLPVPALGAAYLGGTPVTRLAAAGWIDEERPGAATQLGALLGWPVAPWAPTQF
jgi:predicted acetyltransferase